MSKPVGKQFQDVRTISLILRRIRFLSFAVPRRRGVVRPTRLWLRPLESIKTRKERDVFFAPLSYTDSNSIAFRNLKTFGNLFVRINQ
jgi:hypothetical protein